MAKHENIGLSDEWYTPKYIFDALGCEFDLDVAYPHSGTFCHVPCKTAIRQQSLEWAWSGFIWMNPPFGGRMGIVPWLNKFVENGNGIALTPDRTSVSWWQNLAEKADAILFVNGKVKFIRPNGSEGKSPSTGTTLFAIGEKGVSALINAEKNGLGFLMINE